MDGDGTDTDRVPEMRPARGTVTIKPAIRDTRYDGAAGAILLVGRTITGTIDDEGYLVGPDGARGIVVPATDNTELNPTGWNYSVSIAVQGGGWGTAFGVSVPSGQEVDISRVMPIDVSSGTALVADESAAVRAEAAALRAESARTMLEASVPVFLTLAEAQQWEVATGGTAL